MLKPLPSFVLALTLAATLAGCGVSALPGAKAPGAFGARAAAWQEPLVFEDFEVDPYFDFFGPSHGHPLMTPTVFYWHGRAALGEVIALRGTKPHKGLFIKELGEEGSFFFDDDPDDDKPGALAPKARASFKWAVNAEPTGDVAFPALVTYVFEHKGDKATEVRHLTYAWSNVLPVGAVIERKLRWDDAEIDGRILVIEKGNGLGQPASEQGFEQLKKKMESDPGTLVTKDFVASVRYAWDARNLHQLLDGKAEKPAAPQGPIPPLSYGTAPNKEVLGVLGIGIGAEVPKGVSAHALLDEVGIQLMKP